MAGLYVHIPFCRSKCCYCDFYSTPDDSLAERYVDTLISELALRRDEVAEPFTTLYIGGGTPSVLPLRLMERLVTGLRERVDIGALTEFTVEANPDDVTPQLLADYKALGVDRVSIGVQTFDDEMLRLLNRRHDSATARRALESLAASGLEYSADLIYGLPGQSVDQWADSLERLLSYRPPHISSYLLSYEPGTRLYAMLMAGKVAEADEANAEAMYGRLVAAAAASGYEHYEISNFAQPGHRSRHNSAYWTMTPYLGLGVSAHSFDGRLRRYNPLKIKDYIATIADGRVYAEVDAEDDLSRFNDLIITSLRTADGLPLAAVDRYCPPSLLPAFRAEVRALLADGLLRLTTSPITHPATPPSALHPATPPSTLHPATSPDILHPAAPRLAIPEAHWLRSDAILRRLIQV